jgi:predicted secreted protein
MKINVIGAAALALAACAATEHVSDAPRQYSSMAAPTPEGVALVVKGDSDGQNVTTKVGTTIAVELVGVPTAGYVWAIAEKPGFLEAAGEYGGPTSSAQLEEGFAGGNHWEAFLFKVTAAGEGVLRFEQRRPWEDDAEPPVDEFSVYLFAEE